MRQNVQENQNESPTTHCIIKNYKIASRTFFRQRKGANTERTKHTKLVVKQTENHPMHSQNVFKIVTFVCGHDMSIKYERDGLPAHASSQINAIAEVRHNICNI